MTTTAADEMEAWLALRQTDRVYPSGQTHLCWEDEMPGFRDLGAKRSFTSLLEMLGPRTILSGFGQTEIEVAHWNPLSGVRGFSVVATRGTFWVVERPDLHTKGEATAFKAVQLRGHKDWFVNVTYATELPDALFPQELLS